MATRTIGLFGGTFDPPHLGHVAAAAAVLAAMALDELLVTVANEPQGKEAPVASGAQRLEMARAAFGHLDHVVVSDLELSRGGATFTIDTVEVLLEAWPGADIVLVVGADAAAGLAGWHRAGELARLATVAVVPRQGAGNPAPEGFSARNLEMAPVDLSSTAVRAALLAGASPEGLVPSSVVHMIMENRLYSP